VNTSK